MTEIKRPRKNANGEKLYYLPGGDGRGLLLAEIREILLKEDPLHGYNRQHGKLGTSKEDIEADTKRLIANYASRIKNKTNRDKDEYTDKEFNRYYGIVEDEYGIRPVDERRYKSCFKNAPIGSTVLRSYVKMMTGLSLSQILVMQKRTGLIPKPPVTDKEAKDEERIKYETGDYYL